MVKVEVRVFYKATFGKVAKLAISIWSRLL